ncbi:MAG: sugar-binding protein [Planctomycetes bacterium]|nr:sugar-binding protein [Planctomycetota bacterium]
MIRSRLPASLGLAALVAGVAVGLAACSRSEPPPGGTQPIRVAYVTNGVDPFWVIAEAGALEAAQRLGVQCMVQMPPNGIGDQKQILEDLLARGVDGIAVSPIDHVNQTPQLDKLAARLHLITHDSDAPQSKRLCFVGMDNYEAGRMVGELVREALPQGGKVMLFIGRLEQDNARLRTRGAIDAILQRPRDDARVLDSQAVETVGPFTVLGVRTDQFDKSAAKANAADALTAHQDLAAMVGLFAYNPPAILEALRQAGKLGTVKVVGFDESDPTLQGIVDGHVVGTVVQDPYRYGSRSVEILVALSKGDRSVLPADGNVLIPARKITRAGVEAFWAEKKQRLAKPDGR